MADKVGVDPQQSYDDPEIIRFVVETNCDELVKSLDPQSFVLELVLRGLISKKQARDILNDRAKTVSDRNLAFLNLIKSSPDPTWFAALLETLGEERTTERLKEVLEKSYRAVVSYKQHGSSRGSQITSSSTDLNRKGKSSSSQPPAKRSKRSVTDAAGSQEPPSSSDQKGKSSPSQPSAKRSKQSVTDAAATQEPSSSSDQKGKSPKRSRQLQQKRHSTSCGSPAHKPQQFVTDAAASQKSPSSSNRKGKSSSSQPLAKRSKLPVTDAAAFQEPPSSTMTPWNKEALQCMRKELGKVHMKHAGMIKKLEKSVVHSPANPTLGFLSHVQLQVVESKETPATQMDEVIDFLVEMEDKYFEYFCQILEQSNFVGKANMLREKAEHLKRSVDVDPANDVETPEARNHKYLKKATKKAAMNKKANPQTLIMALYRDTYDCVTRILAHYKAHAFSDIMAAARAVIIVGRGDVRALNTADTVADVLNVLRVDEDWEDTRLLKEIVNYLPKDARTIVAIILLYRYNSYLYEYEKDVPVQDMLTKDVSAPDTTKERVEVKVAKDMSEYSCRDCKELVDMLLYNSWQCPRVEDLVDVHTGCTTVVFLIDKAFTGNIIQYSTTASSLWAFRELRVTRVRVGHFELNVVKLLTRHFKEALRSGLTGSMDFVGAIKALPYQVHALVDPDITEKLLLRTINRKIAQPCPEQEELVSGTAHNEGVESMPEMHEDNFPPKVEEEAEPDDEGKIKEATGSGELLSRVQELEDELKNSEWKRVDLEHKNTALMNHLKVCQEQKDHTEQEMASLKDGQVSMLISQDEGKMSEEVTGSGDLLSSVQELEDELKDSEQKRMDLIQSNTALQKILKACREQEVHAQQEIASLWERLSGADKDVRSKRILHRWWLKVSAGSYDTSLLPSSPMKQAKGGREMEGEVVFRRDTRSNLLKAVSGTEWMYRRRALERGRRHQFTRHHRNWLADNVQKEEEESCKQWLLQSSPGVGSVKEREEQGLMSKVYEQALRDYQEKIAGVLIVKNIISDLEPYLTKVEYLQVKNKSGNMAQVDELFRILLMKGNRHFKGFCHVLEDNGYQYWAQQLRSSTDGAETEVSQILEKHEEEFFEVVDAKVYLLRLKRKKVITESLVTEIKSSDSANARELLYDQLYRNADVRALREYCKMAVAADAVPKMQKLGEKMLSELPPEDIQQGQEVIKHGQEVIKHGQEVIQCKQDQHQVVTEQVLAVLQGLGPGQEYISHQLEPRDNAALLCRKPSWTLLQRSVVPRVSANWKAVGRNLHIKDICLSAIEKNKPRQSVACCTEMFSMWLGLAPHTGDLPLTWSSVLSAVGKVDSATSEELLAELKSTTEPHPATLKLAGEMEAYYNRLEAVVGDRLELAVVERQKKEGLRKKKDFEEFLHAAMNGIDEIYEKSYPMEYCQILTLEKGPTTGKHIIVSGAPGSGKTTLVRQLCKDLSSGNLQSGYTLVVLVELRELILLLQDKEEAKLHHFFAKFKHRVDIDQVCRELEESDGRGVLLVLDGFDELDVRMRRCQLLKELLSTESIYLPDCDILVTSRPVTCPDLLGLMQPLHRHIEILGFSEDRIASFIRSYFKCTCQPPPFQPAPSQMSAEGGCEAEKLLSRLALLPQVKGMCRTPVVLNIVCVVCQILGADDLPATMTGIYEAFIRRQLLENGPQGTEMSSILQVPSSDYPFFSDLCRIAFECCTKQKLTISREDIGSTPLSFTRGTIYGLLFEDRVADVRAICGLALYHFMHKTMQEALAACHLAALPDSKSHEEVWKEWFGRPEMAEVWKFYSGFTGLKCVDISSIVLLADEADEAVRTLLVISLFEAGNASLAREELPRIFPKKLEVHPRTSYETAVYAFALQHHPSLERLVLSILQTTGSVNLQLLLDALSHHPTARELHVQYIARMAAEDHAALCQFLRGKHRLAKVELNVAPVEVVVAALSTEGSTMEELRWICTYLHVDDDATGNLLDCLRSTSLRCITIRGNVGNVLLPILRGLAANTKTVDRTVRCWNDFPLDPSLVSQLAAELRQFLVPCVNCVLTMPLPVGVWGTLLSGVGDARQLEQLRVNMRGKPERAGPEWDHIDQPTLEEVEKSWAHSWCREVELDISGGISSHPVQGTLDATMKLLCAVVRGIIQREDQFVLKLQVNDKQVSRLVELEDIAKNKCAVMRTERGEPITVTVLELSPFSSDQKGNSSSSQPPAKRSKLSTGVRRKRKKESSSSQPSSKD